MWRRVCILLASGLAVTPLLFLLPQKEPVYAGRSLSDWVVAMHHGKAPQREQAKAVVHYLGPQSLPVLVKWLRQPDHPSSLKLRVSRVRLTAVRWLERHRLMRVQPRQVPVDWKQSYRFLAVDAFSELGPEARAAIPGLIELLGVREGLTNEVSDTAAFAFVVLRKLAPTSIPALVSALSSEDEQVWTLAAEALADVGPEAHAAIPALRQKLTDRDSEVRVEAADALSKLGDSPKEFVPVVVGTLREPKLDNLDEKLSLLLKYRAEAQDAVPLLEGLLDRVPKDGDFTNQNVRAMLTNALAQLAPDTVRR